MVQITLTQVLVLLSAGRMAAAVQPLRMGSMVRPMALAKRQDLCVGPVICEQTADSCRSCEAGFYCVPGGGCCEEGQVCAGFKPCVNAGTPAPTETQICPTEAPLCTRADGVPVCSGSIEDWITISQALNEGPTTTAAPPTSTPEATSTTAAEPTTYAPPVESTTYAAPTTEVTSVPTYASPPSTTAAYVPPYSNTTVPEPPVATGAGAKTKLGLGIVAGSFLFAVLAL
ncbi:hypothetical protein TWF696_007709 [Orbilia brochopaga]|uniref:Uncharacterized protein n=1 Tax=Orbilia brochopaga TaxID=3140254 RepID=A0AAV9UKX7_9PEZI